MKVKHKAAAVLVAFASVAGVVAYYGTKNDAVTKEQPKFENVVGPHVLEYTANNQTVSYGQFGDLKSCETQKNTLVTEAAWVSLAREQNPQDAQNPIRLAVKAEDLQKENKGQLNADVKKRVAAAYTCRPL